MVASRSSKGFTLVEILVATVILSAVVLIGGSAFALFAERWDGRLGRFDQQLHEAKIRWLVDDVLANITPYLVLNPQGEPRLYFEGNRNGFVAVSMRSLRDPAVPAVVRFSAVQRDDFLYDLLYEEWPMQDRLLLQSNAAIPFEPAITLYSALTDVKFSYFGIPERPVNQRQVISDIELSVTPDPEWLSEYNSLELKQQPLKVAFSWQAKAQESAREQIVTLLAPTPGQLSRMSEPGI